MNLAAGMSESSNINAKYSQILKLQNDLRPKGSYDSQSKPLSEIYDWELAFCSNFAIEPKISFPCFQTSFLELGFLNLSEAILYSK